MATMPLASPSRHRITVDALYRMAEAGILRADERVELIDGEIIDMSPIGCLHATLVARLAMLFAREADRGLTVWSQSPLRLDDLNEPEPDISILRPRADSYATAHPGPADVLLVIEVADTSLAYDLATKVPLYARHGVPEAWVIEALTRRVHVFREPAPTGYGRTTIVAPTDRLACECVMTPSGSPVEVVPAALLPMGV